jgi:VanZ family protein
MSSSERGIRFWLSAWLPVLIGIAVICAESTAMFGADRTSGPLRRLWELLFGPVSEAYWHFQHMLIRKSGHFIGYGALGLLWLRAWWKTRPRAPFLTNALLALLGTALVASGDEYHQTFLPNRTGSPHDVMLDCIGAIVLMSILYLFLRIRAPWRLARAA